MSDILSPGTQFSIYKIDFEEIECRFRIKKTINEDGYVDDVLKALINSTIKIVHQKSNYQVYKVKYNGFYGIIFKTKHEPVWKSVATQLISNNELNEKQCAINDEYLANNTVSYILFYPLNTDVFVLTGGYGSKYIAKFIMKNFGLYLLPKIIKKNNPVLKQIIENNLTGNRASDHRSNRKGTSFIIEQEMSSIFRQLAVEVDRDIAEELGINFTEKESKNKKINLINKDSLVIRRSFTLIQISKVLRRIQKIEIRENSFALNYLVLANKRNIKNADLLEILINSFLKGQVSNFLLVGDEYEDYYINADTYIIRDINEKVILSMKEPITIEMIFKCLHDEKINITKSFVKTLLKKWTISTVDNSGNIVLYPINIFDALQGYVEYGDKNVPCYLFNGLWYVFDPIYDELLAKEYSYLFTEKTAESEVLKKQFKLNLTKEISEDEYNLSMLDNPDVILSHTVLINNIEISDAIFWDKNTLYLMHNKGIFNGNGVRDLTNQILTAADYLDKYTHTVEREMFLGEYYDSILLKYPKAAAIKNVTREEFIKLFNKKICFVAGYIKGLKGNTKSRYSQYLSVELNRKLSFKNYELMFIKIYN